MPSYSATALAAVVVAQSGFAQDFSGRSLTGRENFDQGWKFAFGHAQNVEKDFGYSNGSFSAFAKAGTDAGPIGLGFSDAAWRILDLPHDWAIELPFDPSADLMHGYKPIGRSFPQNSVGWYRKSFSVPASDAGKRLRITFDGIFRDASVWINGHYLGRNESGYIGATFDLTDYVRFGERNVISVRVDATHMEGWFYEGAGIYRHVWLTKSSPVHIATDGVAIVPTVQKTSGRVEVRTELENHTDDAVKVPISVKLLDPEGREVSAVKGEASTKPQSSSVHSVKLSLPNVRRWSVEEPTLYTCVVTAGDQTYRQAIGFRTFRFDPDKGFFLNEKPLRIQGVCNHQDHAGVGVAIPDQLNAWRIVQLKKLGVNFYRTSHNPPTQEVLDACDRLGMMVLDEARMFGSVGEAKSQLIRLVRRDRNHPSVIFWSVGNEEWGTQNSEESARITRAMMRVIAEHDPQKRPSTFGANNGGTITGINSAVDIRGFNYNLGGVDGYRKARPLQPIHGSETASTVTTRGEYADDPKRGYKEAYDRKGVDWGSSAEEWWRFTLAREWFAGGFVWTGFDYRGEPTPYSWPNISSHFGILDTCGFEKDVAFYYKAWWSNEPVLHVLPHWNHATVSKPISVWVFSNHDEVELNLNGKSLGRQKVEKGGHLEWSVPYAPGELVAIGYRAGKESQRTVVATTGSATQLVLETEPVAYIGGPDVAVINIRAVDAQGRTVPEAMHRLNFSIEGSARILGVGNGDPSCHEPDTLVSTSPLQEISGWRYLLNPATSVIEEAKKPGFDAARWSPGRSDGYAIRRPGDAAVFRTEFKIDNASLFHSLDIGPIDDEGQIFLNGALIGRTNTWNASHTFKVAEHLKTGTNVLTIVIKNNGGEGGFRGDARLTGTTLAPAFSRSLFHGRAQVIVQADRAGAWKLTASSADSSLTQASIEVKSRVRPE